MRKVNQLRQYNLLRIQLESKVRDIHAQLKYPVIAWFKNEEGINTKIRVENLPHLVSTFDMQITSGNVFHKFEDVPKEINPEQIPSIDLIDCALQMYCLDCKSFFLINGNCTCKVLCDKCLSETVDFGMYYKHLK